MKYFWVLLLIFLVNAAFGAKVKVVKNNQGQVTSNYTLIPSHTGRYLQALPKGGEILYGYDMNSLKSWKKRYADPKRYDASDISTSVFLRMVSPAMEAEDFLNLGCLNADCSKKIRYEIFEARASFIINKPASTFTAKKVMNPSVLKKLTPEAKNLFCTPKNKKISDKIKKILPKLKTISDSQRPYLCQKSVKSIVKQLPPAARKSYCSEGVDGVRYYIFNECLNSARSKSIRTRVNFSALTRGVMNLMNKPPYLGSQSDVNYFDKEQVNSPGFVDFLSYIKIHSAPVTAMMTQNIHDINFLSKFGSVIILFQPISKKKTLVSVFFVLAVKKRYLDMNLGKIFKSTKFLKSSSSGRDFIMGESSLNSVFTIGGSRLEKSGLPGFGKEIVKSTAKLLQRM